MHRLMSKKVAGVATIAILALAGAAYAYWTSSGDGAGSATTGTSVDVDVLQVGSVTNLVPGGAAQSVDFKITNGASFPQYVDHVTVSITNVTGPNIGSSTPCDENDFDLSGATKTIQAQIPATGETSYSPSGVTLALKNTASNQDGCKGATVALAFAAA